MFLCSLVILGYTITPIDKVLSWGDRNWDFNFHSPDHRILGRTEEFCKSALFVYFKENSIHKRLGSEIGLTPVSLTMLVFSLIGWFRENRIAKNAEPVGAPNSSPRGSLPKANHD